MQDEGTGPREEVQVRTCIISGTELRLAKMQIGGCLLGAGKVPGYFGGYCATEDQRLLIRATVLRCWAAQKAVIPRPLVSQNATAVPCPLLIPIQHVRCFG